MTGTHPEERKPGTPNRINPIAIIAGALASLSAAVIASYFGVAGTLIGTAVVSVVSSLAAAFYAGLLGRTRGLVQRTTLVLQSLPERTGSGQTQGPSDAPGEGRAPAEAPAGRQEPAAAVSTGGEPSSGPAPEGMRAARAKVAWPWRRSVAVVGVAALLIFGIAIGALTGIEAAIKEPIASALGVRDQGQASTSVGVAVDRAGGSDTTRRTSPSSSSTSPPSSSQPGQTPPPTTEPGPSTTTGGTAPPTTTPPTTTPPTTTPSGPSTSGTP